MAFETTAELRAYVEAEMGHTINEPVNYAVRVAIEQSVVELIKEGARKKYWSFVE